jgi:hypothetical protein
VQRWVVGQGGINASDTADEPGTDDHDDRQVATVVAADDPARGS